jgi:hypothetical protein
LNKDADNYYFFNAPENKDIDDKYKEHNRNVWKRGGYKSIYTRLLDIGCFNGLSNTPLKSVKASNFVEAVRILSLKNAGL